MRPFLFESLDREWAVVGDSSAAARQLRRWSEHEPAVSSFAHPAALITFVQRRNQPVESDQILLALVRLAVDDELAGRALLQALLPGLRAVAASTTYAAEPEELDAEIVAAAWTRIRTYPVERRPARVAANIVLDVRKDIVTRHRRRLRAEVAEERGAAAASAAEQTPAAEQLLGLLVHAVREGSLTRMQASLIAQTRLSDLDLAALSPDPSKRRALRRQRRQAEVRLAQVAS